MTLRAPPGAEAQPSRPSLVSYEPVTGPGPRLHAILAVGLVLALVAIPLYLWRRPRAEAIDVTSRTSADASTSLDPASEALAEPAAPPTNAVALSTATVVACQDPGPRRTPPAECDRIGALEVALAKAIEETTSCMPQDASGAIEYVADVSFKKRSITVSAPKAGRTVKNTKAVGACVAAVRAKLRAVALDGITHAHARYKIAIVATYPKAAPARDSSPL